MKKRVVTTLICAGLACTLLLASCTPANQQLQFTPNWHNDIAASSEGYIPVDETLTYEISYTASSGLTSGKYDIAYCVNSAGESEKGSYVTTATYTDVQGGIYEFRTETSYGVLFTYNGTSIPHQETKTSVVRFGKTAGKLTPIYSYVEINSYAPALPATITSVEDCYIPYHYELEINYANETAGTEQSVVLTDHEGTFLGNGKQETKPVVKDDLTFAIDRNTHTYLDNEQVFFALRGLSNSAMSGTSYFNSYNLSYFGVMGNVVSGKEQGNTKDFKDTIINGTAIGDVSVGYNAVTLSLNAQNSGAAYELWYAKMTNGTQNTYRNALLRIKQTLNYTIGTLTFDLVNAIWA